MKPKKDSKDFLTSASYWNVYRAAAANMAELMRMEAHEGPVDVETLTNAADFYLERMGKCRNIAEWERALHQAFGMREGAGN